MNTILLNSDVDVIQYLLDNVDLNKVNKYLFVFPGNRPRMFLFKAIAERLKRPFDPPEVYSFENFLGFILKKANISPDIASDTELLNYLYNLSINNSMFSKYKSHLSLFLPFAQKVLSDYATIVKCGKSETLKNEKDKILKSYQNTELFKVISDYLDIIIALNQKVKSEKKDINSSIFSYAAEIKKDVLADILSPYEKVFLIDIIPLFENEHRFLKNISVLSNTFLLLQKSPYLSGFKFIKDIIKANDISSPFNIKDINIYESPDIHGQILKLKEELFKKHTDKIFESPDTLIMLPEPSTLRIINNLILNELEEDSFNVSIGIPISGMQLAEFLNLVFDLINESNNELNELKTTHFYKFITHIYVQSLKGDLYKIGNDIYNKTENAVYEYLRLEDLKNDYKSIQLFHKLMDNVINSAIKIKTIKDFSNYICDLIKFISDNQAGLLNYGYFNIEAAKIIERFKALSDSPLQDIEIKKSEYKSVFNNFISSTLITPSGSPLRGLQVLGIYESRAIRFKEVYIPDFNDETFFDQSFEDAFLPYNLRLSLGIPPRSEYDNYILYFIDLLFSQCESINVFYRTDEKLTKHRYLLRYIFERKKSEKKINQLSVYYNINLTPYEANLIPKSDAIIKRILSKPISATSLNIYLNCPAKFYYTSILGLEEKEDIDDSVEGNFYGNIIHSTLKEYFYKYIKKESPKKINKNDLFKFLKEEFNNKVKYKSDKFLINYALLEVVLENFINLYSEKEIFKNSTILELEFDCKTEVKIDHKKLQLTGRFDRVDQIDNDEIHIIDYKFATNDNYKITTELPFKLENDIDDFIYKREKYIRKNNNIQLPFYIYLAKNGNFFGGKNKKYKASFLFLRERREKDYIESILEDKTNEKSEPESADENIGIVEFFLKEILNPDVPFFPLESKSCDYCDFYSICHRN